VPHRGRSTDVQREKRRLSCDLLLHRWRPHVEAVIADLQNWLPSLKAGGLLAMHDIDILK